MQIAPHCWSANFREALSILARSFRRLPFGVDEPVLVGAAALELYSGGVWSQGELELVMGQHRALNAALMAEGFRWADRPRHVMPGLWHPELNISAEVVAHSLSDGAADPNAALTLELDAAPGAGGGPSSLRVLGIEDLIVGIAAAWVSQGGSDLELARQMQALMQLAQAGVGGPVRRAYLHNRLAQATAGEVELSCADRWAMPEDQSVRRITEATMLAKIYAWRARRGMSTPAAARASSSSRRVFSPLQMPGRMGRGGHLDTPVPNVLAFHRYPRPG